MKLTTSLYLVPSLQISRNLNPLYLYFFLDNLKYDIKMYRSKS
jgi:hypothetical protein